VPQNIIISIFGQAKKILLGYCTILSKK